MTEQSVSVQERKALAENHLPLVAAMVRRFPWQNREREELYQQGCVGLMKALARYDASLGTAFSTYAAAMILGEMRMLSRLDMPVHVPRRDRELRSRIRRAESTLTAHLGREPTVQEIAKMLKVDPAELVLSMEEISVTSIDAASPNGAQMADLLPDRDDWMNRLLLRDMVSRLPDRDRKLLLLRYRYGLSQTETARRLSMTQVQVSRREMQIKAQLKKEWLDDT
ncbi:MAG: sigma-70 family RNA polymerase sigma factor [Christensenellaceae bacterium]|nr:sigma-70 family RNA polymerase sigma factor [Christensenellaceae bacterium]